MLRLVEKIFYARVFLKVTAQSGMDLISLVIILLSISKLNTVCHY